MIEYFSKANLFYYSIVSTVIAIYFLWDYRRLYVRKCKDIQKLLKTIGELRDANN